MKSVDGLRNYEECRSLVKMNFPELDLGVAMSQSITLVPPSTYQIRETSTDRSNKWDLQKYGMEKRVKDHKDKNTP